ncbi:MAG TPA: Fe-S protein assembly co-chaperone HscB [Flavitalea sp.]|nr:Fe-S protein assembly co-chaperone HscB [Flavitalea sp.]
MNYFELYGLPVLMKVDRSEIKSKFYELNRKYHPDFHAKSDEVSQAEALEKSADINKAYKIFQNTDDTIKYVLQMKDLIHDEEKYELDPEFLTEVMDINEQLMELESGADKEAIEQCLEKTKELLSQIYNDVVPIIENYQEGVTTEKELLQVKSYYYKKKYLQRILDKIYQIRNIASLL